MIDSDAGELFDEWAKSGRGEPMAEGHAPAVEYMLQHAHRLLLNEKSRYRSIDVGCGTGWAVRWLNSKIECEQSIGIDVSPSMIERAKGLDVGREDAYVCANIQKWIPTSPVDLITSMEVLYYLNPIDSFLNTVRESWLLSGGLFIAGLDHHQDNPRSESWSADLNLEMDRSNDNIWRNRLIDAGFSDVETWLKKLEGRKDVTLFIQARKL
ncbi:MAG: hypothetical protein CL992_00025 [Euryarchaeota archaeon]|nr:hypothetical protein [Euryarchaeota archaeon]